MDDFDSIVRRIENLSTYIKVPPDQFRRTEVPFKWTFGRRDNAIFRINKKQKYIRIYAWCEYPHSGSHFDTENFKFEEKETLERLIDLENTLKIIARTKIKKDILNQEALRKEEQMKIKIDSILDRILK